MRTIFMALALLNSGVCFGHQDYLLKYGFDGQGHEIISQLSTKTGGQEGLPTSQQEDSGGFEIERLLRKGENQYSIAVTVSLKNKENKVATWSENKPLLVFGDFGQIDRSLLPSLFSLKNDDLKMLGEEKKQIVELESWVGMYFRYALWALKVEGPTKNILIDFSSLDSDLKKVQVFPTEKIVLQPQEEKIFQFTLFNGSHTKRNLSKTHPELLKIRYAGLWFWVKWLCLGLESLLSFIFILLKNWGISIILLALLIRLAISPVAYMGIKSQWQNNQALAGIKDDLADIKIKYKDDPLKQYEETSKLYKQAGVNPAAAVKGMIALFIQIPVFISLYYVLFSSVDLIGSGFLWVDDLSSPDRFWHHGIDIPYFGPYLNIFPLAMSLFTGFATSSFSSGKENQGGEKIMMYLMTGTFFVLFYSFSAGLVLYWASSSFFQLVQQRITQPTLSK